MIEIRELVIRATVEDTTPLTDRIAARNVGNENDQDCCEEKVDQMLKLIKDKKER